MSPFEKTEKFLDLYRQLERTGRKRFNDAPENAPVITRLANLPLLKDIKDDIEYCRVVRNFLVHTPKVKDMYPVIPSDDMIKTMEKCVNRLNHPIKAMDYSIKLKNMFTADLSTKITYVTDYMNSNGFTHVPVLDSNNRLIGVFSDNAIYTYICENGSLSITSNSVMRDLKDYLPISNHCHEYFAFMKSDVYLYEIMDLFTIDVRSMKKLAGIFFTAGGRADEPIIGMITPYSLLRDYTLLSE
ncbi:MAG: CBS domain-containing protein [Lachnospirales bacterium]